MLAKLQAYGFSKDSLKLLLNYLRNHIQKIKTDPTFSDWINIVRSIPQGSVFGTLHFQIFMNDLLFFSAKCKIYNFGDNNSLYSHGMNLENIFSDLKKDRGNIHE